VAGLRFAAIALRSSDDPQGFIARFSGSEESVAGYLTGEVMARLPAPSGELLRVAAVCSELSLGLAEALLERADAGQVLDDLARGTALVQRTDPGTYRIHPLLRTYLTTDLESHLPELYRRSHIIATQWWLAADDPLHALRHAQRAGEPAVLQSVLRECGVRLIAAGDLAAVQRALDAAGPAGVAYDPWMALLAALSYHRTSALSDAQGALQHARRIWPADPDPALRLLRTSVELLVEGGPPPDTAASASPGSVPAALETLRDLSVVVASVDIAAIDANELRERLASIACVSHERGFPYFEVWAHSVRAAVEINGGQYSAMREAARAAVAVAAAQGHQPAEWAADAGALLAYGDLLAGEPVSARTRAETILSTASHLRPVAEFTLHVVLGTALGDLGERAQGLAGCRAARAKFGDVNIPPPTLAALALLEYRSVLAFSGPAAAVDTAEWLEWRVGKVGEVLLMNAWAHLYDGQYEAASAAVRPIAVGAVAALVPHTPIEVHLVQAETAAQADDMELCRAAVGDALTLGEAMGVVRPFALATGLTGELLRSSPPNDVGAQFAERLSEALRVVHSEIPAPLSERELAVLALLPSLLSGGEIAGELTVSVNTVKSHIRSIYKKLGVSSRREAVRLAQERKLIT
jgi:LuxR family maltose regulon positive regulatory protein